TDFDSITGAGVKAPVAGQQLHIGAERLMQDLGLNVDLFRATAQKLGDQRRSPLYVAINQKLAAIIAVADPIKPTTYSAIQALHDQSLKVAMITGDHQHTAQAIAKQLKIDQVIAQVLPHEKVDAVRQLLQQFGVHTYNLDGLNDAALSVQDDDRHARGTLHYG